MSLTEDTQRREMARESANMRAKEILRQTQVALTDWYGGEPAVTTQRRLGVSKKKVDAMRAYLQVVTKRGKTRAS